MTVTLLTSNGSVGSTIFTLEQLTLAIRGFGRARQHMVCGRSPTPLEGRHIPATFGTSWYVGPELSLGGAGLVFDHPWYGPVAFVVPPDQAEEIARALTLQSQVASRISTAPN